MLRRITQLWPNLLRGNQNDQEEADQILDEQDSPDEATDDQLKALKEQTLDIYKNEYWSRVITVDTHNPDESRRWPLAPDLSEQHEIMFTIDEDDLPKMPPYYDPAEFIKRYP